MGCFVGISCATFFLEAEGLKDVIVFLCNNMCDCVDVMKC